MSKIQSIIGGVAVIGAIGFGIFHTPPKQQDTATTTAPKEWAPTHDTLTWTPVCVSPRGVFVAWQEHYGDRKQDTCVGLWESETQYLLSHRDREATYIEKNNCNSIKYDTLAGGK
jgi:hypothetical protein